MLHQLALGLRLHFRNRMALFYGYLFPSIFLAAFWALYRYEQVPLARHMGELLTVTALGGACFGLPTALVSERERGVWRRYRLTPIAPASLIASTVLARYLLLLSAGFLQVALAMLIGMPLPAHPLDLFLAFSFVCFAFLGLGLVIASLADNVPAVQALGQCIFLPMLVIGGVAVRLASLPSWAQHLSAFFPGRYAVDAIQSTVTGEGLGTGVFSLFALLLIGAAGCIAGTKLFRWDSQQRFYASDGKGWLAVALAAWLVVGAAAEARGLVATSTLSRAEEDTGALTGITFRDRPAAAATRVASSGEPYDSAAAPQAPPLPAPADSAPAAAPPAPPLAPGSSATSPAAVEPAVAPPASAERTWRDVTMQDIELNLVFVGLPPDDGVVAPIGEGRLASFEGAECILARLPQWAPGKVSDPVQRVRNYLFVAAAMDLLQIPELEQGAPLAVFEQLRTEFPKDALIKILYWIATHPTEGDNQALDHLPAACLPAAAPPQPAEARDRSSIYAVKLLGRLLGKIPG
ncbi:MAG: ABC transporter permease [Gemmatimonadetes bacterium]|nr:ABC transporter permease [Gemmatimonadota bacterium]